MNVGLENFGLNEETSTLGGMLPSLENTEICSRKWCFLLKSNAKISNFFKASIADLFQPGSDDLLLCSRKVCGWVRLPEFSSLEWQCSGLGTQC